MRRNILAIVLLSASLIIAVLHTHALDLGWYWTYWWVDIPMHFLGGAIIALLVFFIYDGVAPSSDRNLLTTIGIVLTATLFIGGGWEIFEYIFSLTRDVGYVRDTVKDIFVDLAGALFASTYIVYLYLKRTPIYTYE